MDVWLQHNNRFINLNGNGDVWFSPTNHVFNEKTGQRWIMHIESVRGEKTIEISQQDYKEIVRCLHVALNPFYTIQEEA